MGKQGLEGLSSVEFISDWMGRTTTDLRNKEILRASPRAINKFAFSRYLSNKLNDLKLSS